MLGNVKHSEAVQGLGLSLSVFHFSVGIPQCFPHWPWDFGSWRISQPQFWTEDYPIILPFLSLSFPPALPLPHFLKVFSQMYCPFAVPSLQKQTFLFFIQPILFVSYLNPVIPVAWPVSCTLAVFLPAPPTFHASKIPFSFVPITKILFPFLSGIYTIVL